jgi:hypothetical protein
MGGALVTKEPVVSLMDEAGPYDDPRSAACVKQYCGCQVPRRGGFVRPSLGGSDSLSVLQEDFTRGVRCGRGEAEQDGGEVPGSGAAAAGARRLRGLPEVSLLARAAPGVAQVVLRGMREAGAPAGPPPHLRPPRRRATGRRPDPLRRLPSARARDPTSPPASQEALGSAVFHPVARRRPRPPRRGDRKATNGGFPTEQATRRSGRESRSAHEMVWQRAGVGRAPPSEPRLTPGARVV